MWRFISRLRSLYNNNKNELKRCIGAWFVLRKARDLWRPKRHSREHHVTASNEANRLYIITRYNCFLFILIYIYIIYTLPMK